MSVKLTKNQISFLEEIQKSKINKNKAILLDLAEQSKNVFPNSILFTILKGEFLINQEVKEAIKEMSSGFESYKKTGVKEEYLEQVCLLMLGKAYYYNNEYENSMRVIKEIKESTPQIAKQGVIYPEVIIQARILESKLMIKKKENKEAEKLLSEYFKTMAESFEKYNKIFEELDSENIFNIQELFIIYPLLFQENEKKVELYRDLLKVNQLKLHKIIYSKIIRNLGKILIMNKFVNYKKIYKFNDNDEEGVLLLLVLNQIESKNF
jgi:hypothetical protein